MNLKIRRSILAFVVGLMLAVAGSAFTSVSNEAMVDIQYQYNPDVLDQAKSPDAYSQITGTPPSCGGSELPCIITVPSGMTLSQYLNSFSTNEDVVSAATERKD